MAKIILSQGDSYYSWSLEGATSILSQKLLTEDTDDDVIKELLETILIAKKAGTNRIYNIDRRDPEAIAVLEACGPEYCSGDGAKLVIKQYDETRYSPKFTCYEGYEIFDPTPSVSESTIRACESVENIIDFLRKIGVVHD